MGKKYLRTGVGVKMLLGICGCVCVYLCVSCTGRGILLMLLIKKPFGIAHFHFWPHSLENYGNYIYAGSKRQQKMVAQMAIGAGLLIKHKVDTFYVLQYVL